MDNNSASAFNLFVLVICLGSIVYLVGMFAFVLMVNRMKMRLNTLCIVFDCVFRFFISVFMSIFIWIYWPFKIDIMFGFVFIPGVFSEIITIVLALIIMRKMIIQL